MALTAEPITGRWLELVVTCDPEAVEVAAALFADYGLNEGVVIEAPFTQDADGANVQVDNSRPVSVSTYLDDAEISEEMIDDIRQELSRLSEEYGISKLIIRNLVVNKQQGQDWADAWMAHSSMHHVGRRVVITAPWHDYDPGPDETVLKLDIGAAFGSGGHATTHLCMTALEDEEIRGAHLLDVGAGTGILAIAAALLGASSVDAVDVEPAAIDVARANAKQNGVADIVRIEQGSVGPCEPFQGQYDLVVANILAPILIDLAGGLNNAVRAGGTLILSGIIDFREAQVRDAFEALGLRHVRREELDGWVMLVWRKDECSDRSLPDAS